MSSDIKISKLLLLLLFGLFVFIYIVSSTVVDIYYLSSDPVLGLTFDRDENDGGILVTSVAPKGPADLSEIREGDRILRINGYPFRNFRDQERIYRTFDHGENVEIVLRRGTEIRTVEVITRRRLSVYTHSIFLGILPGVFFCYSLCVIGLFVLLKKINDKTAHIFYLMVNFWALAMWGAFPFGSNALVKLFPQWFFWLKLTYFPLAIGLLLHFTLIFPNEKPIFRKRPKLMLFIAYGSLLLVVLFIPLDLIQIKARDWLTSYGYGIWFGVIFSIALYMLGKSAHRSGTPRALEQARIIYRGTMFTLALPTGLYFLPYNFVGKPLPYAEYALLLVVFWPLMLAYAIVKHRFMDINVIVKRGLAYTLTSGIVVAAYFLLIVGIGKLVLFLTGSSSQFVTIVATLVIAALFNPVKSRVQRFVDARFFPNRFVYREAIRRFAHELVNVVDLRTLQRLVESFLTETMHIRPVVIYWLAAHRPEFQAQQVHGLDAESCPTFSPDDAMVQRLAKSKHLLDISALRESEDSPENGLEKWDNLHAEIVLPLQVKGELFGFIALGAKSDEQAYYKEDIELLETLSDQLNVSLANALLTEELREQERLKKELEVARRIQLSSLPQADPNVPGIDVSGISIPAMEVGGDYYDYLHFPDGRFAVVVGDVSGKGTSAALYMSQLKGILQTAAKFHKSLRNLLIEVNNIAFASIEEQAYITLSCGAFDLKRKRFCLVRAGHLPIIYYSKQNNKCCELTPKGLGVGLDQGMIFNRELEEIEMKFTSGDIFLFYSDGVTEARNAEAEEFESGHLFEIIQSNGYASAFELREKILDQVRCFSGPDFQKDDMTLVAVKIK